MHSPTRFHLHLAGLILTLAAPLPLRGEEVAKRPDGSQASERAASGDDVARELAALREELTRLETKIDVLTERPSEFSPVEVRIVDEQGNPMSGLEVDLTSSDAAQRAKASGESTEDGLALTRHLPYGAYRMNVSGNGWRASSLVTVEVGKPLELTVVAPTPDQLEEVILEASLSCEAVEGLPFGGWKIHDNDNWATFFAPEPQEVQEESSGWQSFPTVSDGIEVVAVVVEFRIERSIEQPDGSQQTWHWRNRSEADDQEVYLRWLVQSDGMLRPLLGAAEQRKEIGSQAGLFEALAPEDEDPDEVQEVGNSSRKERLGYYRLELGEEHHGQAHVRLPLGEIELRIKDIYGRPSQDVLQAIDEPAESTAGELWLTAVVEGNSKWLGRLLGESMTVNERYPAARGFTEHVDLAAEESRTIRVGTEKSAASR